VILKFISLSLQKRSFDPGRPNVRFAL